MEKYYTIAVFFWLGLPLFFKGLILEIDASLNVDDNDGIPATFENHDEYPDHPSANPITTSSPESIKTRSLNIDEKHKGKNDERLLSGVENHDDYQDYTSEIPNSSRGQNSMKIGSLNVDEKYRDQTISKDFENRNDVNDKSDYFDYPLENFINGTGHEMIESDAVIEEIPEDIELIYQMNKKRNVPERGFTEEGKKMMLDLHNLYRGNVTPPAADMNILEWDDNLEHLAQLWADECVFRHGRPRTSYHWDGKVQPYGQNIYKGIDPSGYKSLWMWYEEYMFYEFRNRTCQPDKDCGHYLQLAWAESKRVGCGITLCGLRYILVCHYFPGAISDAQIFLVGKPCSQCNEEKGALCMDKLCVSRELCKSRPEICENATCEMQCQNCGRLNKTSCQCACADGWDSPDCSKPCADEHERCGLQPGFPTKNACPFRDYLVAKKYCRKMCDTCVSVKDDATVNHLCCEGRMCEEGYVLDLERKPCRCTLLCPGPLCDVMEDNSSTLKYNFIHLSSQILMVYFLYYTNQWL